jgi:hypothetical protein
MSTTKTALAALFLILITPRAHALCRLNLRVAGNPPTLLWDSIPGTTSYQVQESFDNFVNSRNYFIEDASFRIDRRASAPVKIFYRVTAMLGPNVLSVAPAADGCTEAIDFTLQPDPGFRTLTRKAIVPIAGSTPGAFGGRFKTSLKLVANGPDERGRIVFHPSGATAASSDPSIAYVLSTAGETLAFDDVVAQMGRSGVGSLDIIPDADASSVVPNVEARLYNDTASGTFGTFAAAVLPVDYLQAPTLSVKIPSAPFRMNMGLRTLTDTRAKALVYGLNGRLREFRDLDWPPEYTVLGTVGQIIGMDVQPGEVVVVFFDGAAIPFYTLTENRTNDPELFVLRHTRSADVGSFVE